MVLACGQEDSLRNTNDKIRDAALEDLLPLWERMHQEGVEFFMDGKQMPLSDVLNKAVKEENVYMADYVLGEEGRIEQVRFDRVTPE